jgi:uncharacterized protein
VDPARVFYLGESLGGAVAVDLALERPPAALVLLSAFTGVRELGRVHYPFVPASVIPDAHPGGAPHPRARRAAPGAPRRL